MGKALPLFGGKTGFNSEIDNVDLSQLKSTV